MNLDVNYIDDQALTDIICQQYGYDCKEEEDTQEDYDKVAKLSIRDAFDAYLTWNGIIGHTDEFIKVYESLKEAERIQKQYPKRRCKSNNL